MAPALARHPGRVAAEAEPLPSERYRSMPGRYLPLLLGNTEVLAVEKGLAMPQAASRRMEGAADRGVLFFSTPAPTLFLRGWLEGAGAVPIKAREALAEIRDRPDNRVPVAVWMAKAVQEAMGTRMRRDSTMR